MAIAAEQFVPYAAAKLSEGESAEVLRVEELYLACGCALSIPAAVAAFEQRYMPIATRAVLGIDAPQDARDEAVQLVREKLLVGSADRPAAIHQYAGRGSLEGWVRVTAVRLALNTLRKVRREVVGVESLLVAQVAANDVELDVVRHQYRAELEQAMTRAFERLAGDQRELLRLYVVDGLTLDELARVNNVNPSTVSRWLKRIRDKLAGDARRHFADQCGLDEQECESVMRAVKSGMHVSVARLLDT